MDGFSPSNWIINPMGAELIPLYATWAATIDPERPLDLNLIIGQIKGEMDLSISTQSQEYLTGVCNEEPAFFMNGYLADPKGYDPAKNAIGKDYHLNMFVNPAFLPSTDLYFQAWHHAVNFSFNRHAIVKIIVIVDKLAGMEKDTIIRLGFKLMEEPDSNSSKYEYFVCTRNDFAPFMES